MQAKTTRISQGFDMPVWCLYHGAKQRYRITGLRNVLKFTLSYSSPQPHQGWFELDVLSHLTIYTHAPVDRESFHTPPLSLRREWPVDEIWVTSEIVNPRWKIFKLHSGAHIKMIWLCNCVSLYTLKYRLHCKWAIFHTWICLPLKYNHPLTETLKHFPVLAYSRAKHCPVTDFTF